MKNLLIAVFAMLLFIGVQPPVYAGIVIGDDQVKTWVDQVKVHYCIDQAVTGQALQLRALDAQEKYTDKKVESKVKAYRRQQLNIGYTPGLELCDENRNSRAPRHHGPAASHFVLE